MGKIQSASTVYATAYLTEKGRKYLFNKGNIRFDGDGNDLLEILYFALSDVDTNYQTAARLTSGDIPDISGKNDNCIKATADYTQKNLVYQTVDVLLLSDPLYSTNSANNILELNVDSTAVFPVSTDTPPIPNLGSLFNQTPVIIGGSGSQGTITIQSDIRLKQDIERIGTSPSGLPIYKFRYVDSHIIENRNYKGFYQGVMAQDLFDTKFESAIKILSNGYYAVDYSALDVEFKRLTDI